MAAAPLLFFTFLGFISLGLPDSVNGIIWPAASTTFAVPLGNLGYIMATFTIGYLLSSLSIGKSLKLLGVGGVLVGSCAIVILSLLGFAFSPTWFWYVASGLLSGLGAGGIDTGLNAFAARNFSARHMSWLHACWGVGATSSAAIATYILGQGYAWPSVPLVIAAILLPVTILFFFVRKTWSEAASETKSDEAKGIEVKLMEGLRHPTVRLQALIFFFYVGVESMTGQWAFTVLTQSRGFSVASAGTMVSCYWGSLTLGRFLLGTITDRWGVRRLILLSTSLGLFGGLLFVFAKLPWTSALGLLILGFSLAPIYPGMMSQTPERLGRLADVAIGIQVAAAMLSLVMVPSLIGYFLGTYGFGFIQAVLAALLALLWILIFVLFAKPTKVCA